MVGNPIETGKSAAINLTGMMFGWDIESKRPLLISVEGSPNSYWPVFDTKYDLDKVMSPLFDEYLVKKIDDHSSFITGTHFPDEVILIANPKITAEGKLRWMQLGNIKSLKQQTFN